MFTFPGTSMSSVLSYPPSPYPSLLYSNSGTQDTNGIFYYFGTDFGTAAWTNPATASYITISTSGSPTGAVSTLVDRDTPSITQCVSVNTANNFFSFALPLFVILTGVLLRTRNTSTGHIRNWAIQGSNDNSAWTNIITYSANTTLNAAAQYAYFPISTSVTKYAYIRILHTGANSAGTNVIALSEVELYGYLYDS